MGVYWGSRPLRAKALALYATDGCQGDHGGEIRRGQNAGGPGSCMEASPWMSFQDFDPADIGE